MHGLLLSRPLPPAAWSAEGGFLIEEALQLQQQRVEVPAGTPGGEIRGGIVAGLDKLALLEQLARQVEAVRFEEVSVGKGRDGGFQLPSSC